MADYVKMIVAGRLTRDPEIKQVTVGDDQVDVCNFTVATSDRRSKNKDPKTLYVEVTAWRGLARICNEYLSKGRAVLVETSFLDVQTWSTQDGDPRASLKVNADTVQFLGSGSRDDGDGRSQGGQNSQGAQGRREAPRNYDRDGGRRTDNRGSGGGGRRDDNRGGGRRDDYARSGSRDDRGYGQRYDNPADDSDVPF